MVNIIPKTFRQAYERGGTPSRVVRVCCLLISCLFYLTAAVNTSSAATYYLDASNGDDSNPGTNAEPWGTIDKAFSIATYGDTVLIRDGNYGDFVKNGYGSFPAYEGDMNAPLPGDTEFITFRAEDGHNPYITKLTFGQWALDKHFYTPYIFDGLDVHGMVLIVHSVGIRLQNLEVVGASHMSGYCIKLSQTGSMTLNDIQIINCTLHEHSDGINAFGKNIVIRGCDIYDIGENHMVLKGMHDTIVENNIIRDTKYKNVGEHPDGIAMSSCQRLTIRNNVMRNLETPAGCQGIFFHGGSNWSSYITIENNLIYRVKAREIQLGGGDHITIRHNTIIGHQDWLGQVWLGLASYGGLDAVDCYNNLFVAEYVEADVEWGNHDYNIFAQHRSSPEESNSYAYDTLNDAYVAQANLFVDPDNNDYRLKEGCRAIDFGTAEWNYPTTDILGNTRDAHPDAGCYEYVSSDPNNPSPVLQAIGNKSVNENVTLTFDVNATDPNGGPLTYSAENLPSGATFSNQSFSWTPSYEQAGTYQVRFITSDGNSQDSETITITVNNVNRAPVLGAISNQSVDENSLAEFLGGRNRP